MQKPAASGYIAPVAVMTGKALFSPEPPQKNFGRRDCGPFILLRQGFEAGTISDVSEAETTLRQILLRRARKKFFLCDASKIGVQKMFTVCGKEDIDDIVCDVPLPWEK